MSDDEYKDKLKTIGVSLRKGTSERKPVTDERDGSVGGFHVEHWDDRQDAHVIAKPVPIKARPQEGGEDR